jgi:hypothetical protein
MALTECKECGQQVSTDSRYCPHCGKNKPAKSGMNGCLTVFLIFMGLGVLGSVIGSLGHLATQTSRPELSEAEKRKKLRESLDPPSSAPLTSQQHLDVARRLLAKIDVNRYEEADVLIQLTSAHATEARKNPSTKAQADVVMKRMSNKALDVVKAKAWITPGASITAEVECKHVISSKLKAPSTADWSNAETARWKDHPGSFLVNHTVDAQNSYGAKIRAKYQCQVVCLSEAACEVTKIYEIER